MGFNMQMVIYAHNTATDVLAPCVTRSSATTILAQKIDYTVALCTLNHFNYKRTHSPVDIISPPVMHHSMLAKRIAPTVTLSVWTLPKVDQVHSLNSGTQLSVNTRGLLQGFWVDLTTPVNVLLSVVFQWWFSFKCYASSKIELHIDLNTMIVNSQDFHWQNVQYFYTHFNLFIESVEFMQWKCYVCRNDNNHNNNDDDDDDIIII